MSDYSDAENSAHSESENDNNDDNIINKLYTNKYERRYHALTSKYCKLSNSEISQSLLTLLSDIANAKNCAKMDNLRQDIINTMTTIQNTCDFEGCGLIFNSSKAKANHIILKHGSAHVRAIEKLKFEVDYNDMRTGKKSTGDPELNKKVKTLPKKGHRTRAPNKHNTLCFFVTIKPAKCDVDTLIKIIDFIKSTDYAPELLFYVFEQRADNLDNMGDGAHIHAIVKKSYSVSVTKKYLYQATRKVNKFFDCINSLNCIDVVDVRCSEHLNNVINYMKGIKKPEKMPVCNINVQWRAKFNIQPFYNLDEKHVVIPEQVNETKFENSVCLIETCGNLKFCVVVVDGVKHRFPIV
jgi:hypothetical protein